MKFHYSLQPIKFEIIGELPNAWSNDSYIALLDVMEYGDTSDLSPQELKEMCMLSLSDNEADEAAKIVLQYIFENRLNAGQIDNLSHEMIDEKVWEEYAELSMHEELFNATQLLYEAYNGKFPHPEAVRYTVNITCKEPMGMRVFEKEAETALLRLLVQGMPENTLIHRLFDEQLEGGDFADAKDIIWQFKKEATGDKAMRFELISSTYWLHDLKYAEDFEAILTEEEQD